MGNNNRENLDYFMEEMNCSYAIYPYSLISRERIESLDAVGNDKVVNKKKLISGGFIINRSLAREGHTPFMFLTNCLLDIFKRPLSINPKLMNDEYADLIEQSLLDFYEMVTDERVILDTPLKAVGDKKRDMIKYLNEGRAVEIVLEQFMGSYSKKDAREPEMINDIVNIGTVFHEAFNERLAQARHFYVLTNKGIGTWYCSLGILPLVWCEIKFCIENQIKIKVCPYCGKFYVCPPNNPNKRHCGEQACLYQYNKESRGPNFEAERKSIRVPGRSAGRPKKVVK